MNIDSSTCKRKKKEHLWLEYGSHNNITYTNNHTHAHTNDESTSFTVKALSIMFNVGTPKHRNTGISSILGRDTNHMSMI